MPRPALLEAERVEAFLHLLCRPRMTTPAYDPQIRECFAQRTWRMRIEPEYEPAARHKCSVNVLQRCVDDFPADIIVEAYMNVGEYGELSTVVNSVLEKQLAPPLVADFRSVFLERRKRLALALAATLPNTTAEQLLPLTFHIFVHVPGLWPFCHPNPAWSKLLAEPRFTHLNFDFKTEMSRYLRIILKEALNK